TCREGAQGVGQACTDAFVASFMSILAIDFAIAVIANPAVTVRAIMQFSSETP
ncbi:MAG: hypothetical protein HN904_30445, partial [Victivallales bacterium]|nr:hypothetical protein [Victivallales bacterium]